MCQRMFLYIKEMRFIFIQQITKPISIDLNYQLVQPIHPITSRL